MKKFCNMMNVLTKPNQKSGSCRDVSDLSVKKKINCLKIRSLEGSNKSLLDQVEALQNIIKDVAVQRDLESGVHDDSNVNITDRVRDESQNLRTEEDSGSILSEEICPSGNGDRDEKRSENQKEEVN